MNEFMPGHEGSLSSEQQDENTKKATEAYNSDEIPEENPGETSPKITRREALEKGAKIVATVAITGVAAHFLNEGVKKAEQRVIKHKEGEKKERESANRQEKWKRAVDILKANGFTEEEEINEVLSIIELRVMLNDDTKKAYHVEEWIIKNLEKRGLIRDKSDVTTGKNVEENEVTSDNELTSTDQDGGVLYEKGFKYGPKR